MFKASNEDILKKNINITWETYDFNKPNVINNFFAIDENITDSVIFQTTNSFEEYKKEYWSKINDDLISKDAFEGENSFLLKPDMFSCSFTFPLDSIKIEDIRIEADCWVKEYDYKKSKDIIFVISIENNEGNTIWKGLPIDGQLIDRNKWNHIMNFVQYRNTASWSKLKGYLWNNSNSEVLVDKFRVRVSTDKR